MSELFSYTKIPYFFLTEKEITSNELFLYVKLISLKLATKNMTYTNIDILSQDIIYSKRIDRNKIKIKEIIQNLKRKEIINYDVENLAYSTLLKIEFPYIDEKENFIIITFDEYQKFKNPDEFFIYVHIKKWGKLGCRKSYEEWAKLLGYKSSTTARNLLYNMNEKNIIGINTGSYYIREDYFRQEVNEYSLPDKNEKVKKRDKRDVFVYKGRKYKTDEIINRIIGKRDNGWTEYLQEVDYAYVQEYNDVIDQSVKKIFNIRFNAFKKVNEEKASEWECEYKNWKNEIELERILEKDNLAIKLKDGSYVAYSEDFINTDCLGIVFVGTYVNDEGVNEYRKNMIRLHEFDYDKNIIKEMVKRIKNEGKEISVYFVEDYKR